MKQPKVHLTTIVLMALVGGLLIWANLKINPVGIEIGLDDFTRVGFCEPILLLSRLAAFHLFNFA